MRRGGQDAMTIRYRDQPPARTEPPTEEERRRGAVRRRIEDLLENQRQAAEEAPWKDEDEE